MQKPTVHLNGTGRAELQEQFSNAYRALGDVMSVIQAAVPNGRDYYVQEPNGFNKAREEHFNRLKVLRDMREEYLELFESCEKERDK